MRTPTTSHQSSGPLGGVDDARSKVEHRRWFQYLRQLYVEADHDDIVGGASEMAFRFFLAAFPFLLFVVEASRVLANLLNVQDPSGEIVALIGDSLPDESANIVRGEVEAVLQNTDPGLLSLSFVAAVWVSATGIASIMKNLNKAFDVDESRPYLKRYALAVTLTLCAGVLIIAALMVSIIGQVWGLKIAADLGLSGLSGELLPLIRFPIVIALVLIAASFIYWLAPNTRLPFHWITPGTAVFIVGWIIASYGYGFYVANVASYGALYGTLGGVVVSLIWFYMTAFVLLLGGQINAMILKEAEPEAFHGQETSTARREDVEGTGGQRMARDGRGETQGPS